MCGRYNLEPDAKAWLDSLAIARDLLDAADWQGRYNIAPGTWVAIIRAAAGGDALVVDKTLWGFVPKWMKEEKPKSRPINARAETIASKPFFRDAFKHRRCLFIASGYYEWQATPAGKQPFNIVQRSGEPFLMAGIWDNWRGDDTAAIITIAANDELVAIHDRMPVMITPEDARSWLLDENPSQWLRPAPAGQFWGYPVSNRVNNPANDSPANIEAVAIG
ncbi:SOS response-associated peptidase [Halioxenophilus sp. WMMB6]|uniref:SOS response-associated peptidase n=1 Tax=Halioxenophilus sp. WMMB6 TaxID=3073815 RepID=UPI00295ED120|nr:SOS response-associated peptidase [Halioxenophilus sp. WMMB6]